MMKLEKEKGVLHLSSEISSMRDQKLSSTFPLRTLLKKKKKKSGQCMILEEYLNLI